MASVDAADLQELRELLSDLRDASADGRKLAESYADLLRSTVDGYCAEFDKRAEALLAKLGGDA